MQGNTRRTLYVGGLDDSVNESLLHAAFLPFGDITDVQIPVNQANQKHRGFGFVEFEIPEDAAAALDNMNHAELYGRVLKINYAKPISTVPRTKAVWNEDVYHESKEKDEATEAETETETEPEIVQTTEAESVMEVDEEIKE